MVKFGGGQRESDGVIVPAGRSDVLAGKGPDFGHASGGGKREGMPGTARSKDPGGRSALAELNRQPPVGKVRQLQRKLWAVAKQSKARRFHALYDRIFRGDVLEEAWRRVRANRGAAGVDGQTLAEVEGYGVDRLLAELALELREGRYRPAPSRRVEIPKPAGGVRPLGIPAVRDRIVQQAAKLVLEPIFEADFAPTSYGYRPGRSATDALERIRTGFIEGRVWACEIDIRSFFDFIDHEVVLGLMERRVSDRRVLKLARMWLKAGVMVDGAYRETVTGTPQGGVISPLLANIFLHYAFDAWMAREYPTVRFERYCHDVIVHATSEKQARKLREAIAGRLAGMRARAQRAEDPHRVLQGCQPPRLVRARAVRLPRLRFRPRLSKSRFGKHFVNFSPAVSDEASERMRHEMRRWGLHRRSDKTLMDLARMFNAVLQGWINYYGRFYKSRLYPTFYHLNEILVRWALGKYKRLRRHRRRARRFLADVARREPNLFAHWRFGVRPDGWTMGAR